MQVLTHEIATAGPAVKPILFRPGTKEGPINLNKYPVIIGSTNKPVHPHGNAGIVILSRRFDESL